MPTGPLEQVVCTVAAASPSANSWNRQLGIYSPPPWRVPGPGQSLDWISKVWEGGSGTRGKMRIKRGLQGQVPMPVLGEYLGKGLFPSDLLQVWHVQRALESLQTGGRKHLSVAIPCWPQRRVATWGGAILSRLYDVQLKRPFLLSQHLETACQGRV